MRRTWALAIVAVALAGCSESSTNDAESIDRTPGGVSSRGVSVEGGPQNRAAADEARSSKRRPIEVAADAAPDFTVTTFEGERFRLHEQAGTPVVLNFWESW